MKWSQVSLASATNLPQSPTKIFALLSLKKEPILRYPNAQNTIINTYIHTYIPNQNYITYLLSIIYHILNFIFTHLQQIDDQMVVVVVVV